MAGSSRLLAAGPGKLSPGCQTNAWNIDRHDFSTFLSVLEQIQGLQFSGFETGFANVQEQFGNSAARRQIEALGLRFTGIHIFLPAYDPQTNIAPAGIYRRVAGGGAALGAERLILSAGPVAVNGKLDDSALHRKTQAIMEAAKFAQSHGLRLAYHNETPESLNDGLELRALWRETDPSLVSFLLDAGHADQAGINVPAFFREHFKRIVGLHLRDCRDGRQVPLGQGTFDLAALAKTVEETGWSGWVISEEDYPSGFKPGSAAIKVARESIRRAFHV
ncbi:MAG: sugar phosphate isomerase/epimerase family protein [Terriglobia bacterium]